MTRPPVDHYIHGQWEAIDVIRGMMPAGLTPMQGYLWGSAMKYMFRFQYKGAAAEDLHKAMTYTGWLKDDIEAGK
jgi:hypothetical protein